MLHSVLFYLFMITLTIPLCILAILFSIRDKIGITVHKMIAVPWAKLLLKVSGIKIYVDGLKNIRNDKQYIFVTNHQSYFDILALLSLIPVPFAFVMKEELMDTPLLGEAMKRAGYIGISREDPRRAIEGMKKAELRVRQGFSLVIFPEGTRSLNGTLGEFKRGAFNLALRTRLDMVPVAIKDSFKIVKKGSLRIRKGSFSVSFLYPVETKGVSKKDIPKLVLLIRERIEKALNDAHCPGSHTASL